MPCLKFLLYIIKIIFFGKHFIVHIGSGTVDKNDEFCWEQVNFYYKMGTKNRNNQLGKAYAACDETYIKVLLEDNGKFDKFLEKIR